MTIIINYQRIGRRLIPLVAALALTAGAAFAGPFDDARKAFGAGDYQSAARLLEQAKAESPNDPLVFAALGNTYRRLGNNDGALQAYNEVVRLDPTLRTIRDKSAFSTAYQAVGGDSSQLSAAGSVPSGGGDTNEVSSPSEIISALTSSDVYVGPELRGEVDESALQSAAQKARPTVVKIVAIRSDSAPWLKQYKSRDAFADDLRQRLNLSDDSVVIVGTPKGIAGSSGRLSRNQLQDSLKSAGIDAAFAQGGLTQALVTAAGAVSGTAVSDRRTDTGKGGGLLFLILAIVGGIIFWQARKRKRAMDDARTPIEPLRQKTLEGLGYVDGYLDLLPAGDEATRARALRQSAYEKYATATGVLKAAKDPREISQAAPLLQNALSKLDDCRAAIDRATGGTGVAMKVPETPSLETDEKRGRDYLNLRPVEAVGSAAERQRYQQMVEQIPVGERGVSFFSGRPVPSDELVPVEIVVGGRKRTVMASRDEADSIARGQTPSIRAFEQDGRYIPWYEYRGYDPYRDYYSGYGGSGLGTLVDLYLLTNILGPGLWTGYGPWGYGGFGWGMPMPPMVYGGGGGYYGGGYDGPAVYSDRDFGIGGDAPAYAEPDHAASFDFFGGGGNSDTLSNDSSGFDFGGSTDSGDSGGFDFGSSDSGGGFDFGGDSGGGDFGGGGDSGGGGGDW